MRLDRCTVGMHCRCVFFFNDTATTEIYPPSLHDALPILLLPARGVDVVVDHLVPQRHAQHRGAVEPVGRVAQGPRHGGSGGLADRKSTRLNSSHANISYAVFCLKKKIITVTHQSLYIF